MQSSVSPVIELVGVSRRFSREHRKAQTLRHLLRNFLGGQAQRSESFWALQDINLRVEPGERLALLGNNGAGKSTLLRIIAQTLKPTNGLVSVHGRVIPLLRLGLGFDGELTGEENVYLKASLYGLNYTEIQGIYDEVVEFAELRDFIDTPLKHYSSGMEARLAFAVAAHLPVDILILDEALATGDACFVKKCGLKIQELLARGITCIAATHNLGDLEAGFERACYLKNGRLVRDGTLAEVVPLYLGQENV